MTRITSFHEASVPQSDLLFYPFTDNLPQRSRVEGEGGERRRRGAVDCRGTNVHRKEKKIYSGKSWKSVYRKNDWVLGNKGKPPSARLLFDGLSICRHWPFPLYLVNLTYKQPFSPLTKGCATLSIRENIRDTRRHCESRKELFQSLISLTYHVYTIRVDLRIIRVFSIMGWRFNGLHTKMFCYLNIGKYMKQNLTWLFMLYGVLYVYLV